MSGWKLEGKKGIYIGLWGVSGLVVTEDDVMGGGGGGDRKCTVESRGVVYSISHLVLFCDELLS